MVWQRRIGLQGVDRHAVVQPETTIPLPLKRSGTSKPFGSHQRMSE